jgi:hypothetical protein
MLLFHDADSCHILYSMIDAVESLLSVSEEAPLLVEAQLECNQFYGEVAYCWLPFFFVEME